MVDCTSVVMYGEDHGLEDQDQLGLRETPMVQVAQHPNTRTELPLDSFNLGIHIRLTRKMKTQYLHVVGG